MMNPKPFQKRIAIVLLAIFLPSLFPVNLLYANNNGPVAPEAASFEPVDATDMVNLVTGDMSYVMPIMNVPSPEGGYPLSLSYHAGIAMDQEASWVGLGWNLNPGALNRSVNEFPDDWDKTSYSEFFYDQGTQQDYYYFSIGGTLPNGITLGLGTSWGSNRSFAGHVTFGYGGATITAGNDGVFGLGLGGFNVGSDGASIGLGGSVTNSLGLGLNYDLIDNSLSGSINVLFDPY